MRIKIWLAIAAVLTLLICGCDAAVAPEPTQLLGTRVDALQLISDPQPARDEVVTLLGQPAQDFLKDYYFGKGPEVVKSTEALLGNLQLRAQAVTFSWSCAQANSGYTLAYATEADFSDVITVQTQQASVTVLDLYVAKTYYWQVVTHTETKDHYSEIYTFHTEATPRIISLSGVCNIRDIGGYLTEDGKHRVAQGMVYRGGNLDSIDGDGMRKALDVYGIRTDLDLRSPSSESDNMLYTDKSPILLDINYINIPGISYASALPASQTMGRELLVFAEPENYPVYIHCKVGRDRTGTLIYILGALLGLPEQTLLADYELTYLTEYAYAADDLRGHNYMMAFLEKFHQLQGDTLQQKAETYCRNLGITDEQIQSIRSTLLEGVN